jgi:hypothetical protein
VLSADTNITMPSVEPSTTVSSAAR